MMIRMVLFALLSVLIFAFALLITARKDALPERLKQVENAHADAPGGTETGKKRKGRALSFPKAPKKVQNAISEAGVMLRVEEYMLIWISAAVLSPLLCFALTGSAPLILASAAGGAAAPPMFLKAKKAQRLKSFGNQLSDALLLIANGLRAGFSFEQVLDTVASDMPDPIASEFARVSRELKMGMTLEESLTALTERMQNTDMRLLTSAVLIQRQVGGNLAEILDTISDTIQDRIKIKNNVASMTAQGKISGLIVGGIPVFLYVSISVTNPEYMEVFTTTLYGKILLLVAAAMETAGFLAIRKLCDLEG